MRTYIRHVYAVYSCGVYITYYYIIIIGIRVCYGRVRTIYARAVHLFTQSSAILLPGQWRSLVPHTTAVCRTIVNEKLKENH